MSDHLGSKHFVFFQFGFDWQKYQANFTNQVEFRKNQLCRQTLSRNAPCYPLTLAKLKKLIDLNRSHGLVLRAVSLCKCYISFSMQHLVNIIQGYFDIMSFHQLSICKVSFDKESFHHESQTGTKNFLNQNCCGLVLEIRPPAVMFVWFQIKCNVLIEFF